MTIELVEVKLHPIPKFDITTANGKARLDNIVNQGDDYPYFPVQVEKQTVESRSIPFYFFSPVPIESTENKRQVLRVYDIVYQKEEIVDGKKIVVAYGTIGRAANLS